MEEKTTKQREYKLRVVGGLGFYEVSVAFRKVLQDGKTYEACFWAFVLLQSGYHKHIWKHLAIFASQSKDGKIIEVSALRTSFDQNTTAKDRKTEDGFCYICRAIVSLCNSQSETLALVSKVIRNFCSKCWPELT